MLVVLAAVACAPDRGAAYAHAFAAATRAESAGRYGEAAERFEEASRSAKVPRDGAHAWYLAALMRLRAGDVAEARARLDAIGAAAPPTEDSAMAAYRAAEIRIDAGDAEGWRLLELAIRRFPSHGVARPALQRLLRHDDETVGEAQTLAYVREAERTLGTTELGEELAYAVALRLAHLGQTKAARDAFVGVADRWPYPGGALFDDALYRASELDEALGDPHGAVTDLNRLLAEREVAHLSGSYQRPRYGPALWRVATLYRDRLGDNERARDAFHRLYAEFTTSPLRDDALWQEALLWREDGDTGTACARLATLSEELPDSRYVPCAVQLCPRVRRAEKSRAPTTCHAYIERRAEETAR